MVKRFKKIPHFDGYVSREPKTTHTTYIQNPMTGEMDGRIDLRDESPPRGYLVSRPDDSTGVLRVQEPFSVGKKKYEPGEIVGRTQRKGIPLRKQKRANQKKYFASRRSKRRRR